MAENGDNVLKVVELFVDNINEANKNVVKDLDRIDETLDELNKMSSTPPRNEELEKDHKELDEKLDLISNAVSGVTSSIKLMINTVRVSIAILALAAIITGGITHFGNKSLIEQLNKRQDVELKLLKDSIKDLKKGQGDRNEKLEEGNG